MGLAAGGSVIAGELWIPGQKLISIPKSITFPTLFFEHGSTVVSNYPKALWPGVDKWFKAVYDEGVTSPVGKIQFNGKYEPLFHSGIDD